MISSSAESSNGSMPRETLIEKQVGSSKEPPDAKKSTKMKSKIS